MAYAKPWSGGKRGDSLGNVELAVVVVWEDGGED